MRRLPNRLAAPPLADPGYARDEQLKVQSDQLQEQADTLNATSGVEAVGEDAFLADEELQAVLTRDGSEVSGSRPGQVYMWVCVEYPASARGINVMNLTSIGWQVVKGDDPEALEYRTVDGTRKLGDSILLRIDARKKHALDYRIDQLNARREGASTEELRERAARYGIKLVSYDDMTPEQQRNIERRSSMAMVRQGAVQKLDRNLREGTVPGVAPGV